MKLKEIITEQKSGNECFSLNNQDLDFNLIDFWIWNQSNLIENRTRGILAEFIVKQALNIINDTRIEWDSYDLETENGIKIEIKSASYIQSWKQKKYSEINFGIAPTKGEPINPKYDGKYRRWSDFYVFCLLEHKNQNTIRPMDINQWTFYVLRTEVLDKKKPNQKSIGLNSLLKLKPIKCSFNELKKIIK
ncbi:MAG: hypothetical protein V3V16_12855 [Melioribacteraceae bacterium]